MRRTGQIDHRIASRQDQSPRFLPTLRSSSLIPFMTFGSALRQAVGLRSVRCANLMFRGHLLRARPTTHL